jgi:hypothetical protein
MARNPDCAQHSVVNAGVRRTKIARAALNERPSPAKTIASPFAASSKLLDMKIIFRLGRGYLGRKEDARSSLHFGLFSASNVNTAGHIFNCRKFNRIF